MAELYTTSLYSDANLVSYYRLFGNSNDEKGANNGTDTSISYVAGKFNDAASFNGSSSKIATGSQWFPSSDFTVHCWVNVNNLASDNRICAQEGNDAGDHQFRIMTDGTVRLQRWNGVLNNFSQWTTASQTISGTGSWFMVDIVFDGVGIASTFYINNVSESPTVSTGTSTEAAVNFQIGTAFGGFFDGIIDDFAVFNRQLTSGEINTLYVAGPGALNLLLLGVGV